MEPSFSTQDIFNNKQSFRFTALDIFRGITICFMIVVNSPGAGAEAFTQLNHAAWHGFTLADLVFPSFLFAVGNSLSFSERKYLNHPFRNVFLRILQRSFIIFLLGFLMYWFPFFRIDVATGEISTFPIGETRIMGVLQRIALCYLLAAVLVYWVRSSKWLIVLSGVLLIGYWLVLLAFGDSDPYSVDGNAVLSLDLWVFGASHMYVDGGVLFEPEGLLSTFPALVNTLAGYLVGKWIQKRDPAAMQRLLWWGVACIAAALLWNAAFPINKKLWTSTFVLLTVGLDMIILVTLVYFTRGEQQPISWGRFFIIFGKNPLIVYYFSELVLIAMFRFPCRGVSLYEYIGAYGFQRLIPGSGGSLLFALCYMMLCWGFAWYLDQKKIYIKA